MCGFRYQPSAKPVQVSRLWVSLTGDFRKIGNVASFHLDQQLHSNSEYTR